MAVELKSNNLPALLLEVAEQLRKAEAALPKKRVSISYGNSNSPQRIATITANLPVTRSRDISDAGTKFLYDDYAPTPGGISLVGTPLAGMAIEGLAEALGVAAEELDAAERFKLDSGASFPAEVGCGVSIANLEATITAAVAYNVSINSSGQPVLIVTNHVA